MRHLPAISIAVTVAVAAVAVTAAGRRFGQRRAEHMRASRLEAVQSLDRRPRPRLSALNNEQHIANSRGEERRIGKTERRRAIDHNQVELFIGFRDDLSDPSGRQQIRRIRRYRSTRKQPEIGMLRLEYVIAD